MRVAVVTTSYPAQTGSAAGHFVESEARAFAAAGHEVRVYAPGSLNTTGREDSAVQVTFLGATELFSLPGALPRLKERPWRGLHAFGFVRTARQRLRADGPFDLIQAHWLLPSAWPIAADSPARIEAVCHGSDLELLLKLPRWLRAHVIHRLSRDDIQLRFVSSRQRNRLAPIAPELCRRSRVEPCALDLSMAPSRAEARRSLALAEQCRLALVIGRLIDGKSVERALAGLSQIPALTTRVIGDGPLRRTLATRYPGAGFLGQLPRTETLRWLAAADVLVSASRHEGAPTAIREARRLDVPVVAAKAGDLEHWAQSDPGIQLFHDPSELLSLLRRFVNFEPSLSRSR